jgi:4-amino-4-deoxy-L-arabinose transferase-like glycosyltransferase
MKDTSMAAPGAVLTDAGLPAGVKVRSVMLLAGACFALFFWHLGEAPFYVRGEPREGLVVQAMEASADWTLPVVNGSYIPFKPPLFHWAALFIAKTLGRIDELTLRLPSAIFATLGVFLTYFAAARLWEEKAGFASAAVLATNHEWWTAASLAQVDMALAFFMTAALMLFLLAYRNRGEEIGVAAPSAIALLLGCATLAKGPVGLAIPLLIFFCFLSLRRELALLRKSHLLASAALFCIVAGSWYLLALRQGGQAFFLRQIVNENFRTAVGAYGHYQSPFYFVPAWLSNMLPWSLFFPAMALFAYRKREWLRDERVVYLLVWFAAVFLFFSLARGKRSIYILPLYPAAALLFGAWWAEFSKNPGDGVGAAKVATCLAAAICLAVPAVLLLKLLGWNALGAMRSRAVGHADLSLVLNSLQSPSLLVWSFMAVTAAAGLLLAYGAIKNRWNMVFVSLAVATVASILSVKQVYLPALAAEKTLKPFMTRVRGAVDKETAALYAYRFFDYGAVFYAARYVLQYPSDAPFPKPPFFLLMWESEWEGLPKSAGVEIVDSSEALGANKRQHMALVRVGESIPALEGAAVNADDEE